jgi:hypothetical protein
VHEIYKFIVLSLDSIITRIQVVRELLNYILPRIFKVDVHFDLFMLGEAAVEPRCVRDGDYCTSD